MAKAEESYSDTWAVCLQNDSFLPGANGPHMGMGIDPPEKFVQKKSLPAIRQMPSQEDLGLSRRFIEASIHTTATRMMQSRDMDKPSVIAVPRDIVVRLVFVELSPKQLTHAAQVCYEWKVLSGTSTLWKNLFLNIKFWRIWYNEPHSWKSEFQRRHMQEFEDVERFERVEVDGLLNEQMDDQSEGQEGKPGKQEQLPVWHPRWHGNGDGASEGVPYVVVAPCEPAAPGAQMVTAPDKSIGNMDDKLHFNSIQEAINEVPAGTRIILDPGVYHEKQLEIDKSVEIVGRGGQAEAVVIKGNIELKSQSAVRLANVNIETQPTDNDEGSVRITGKATRVEDCDIHGSVIITESSDCLLRNNRIHGGQQNGVTVTSASGTIVNNDVTGHKLCGIVLKGDANPDVKNNAFNKNGMAGVVIGDDSQGKFEGNRFASNNHYGVAMGAMAAPTLVGNHCTDNGRGGVLASGNSAGKFENNEVKNNTGHGIMLAGTARMLAVGNTFSNNTEAGMALCEDSRASVEENRMVKNAGPGVIIQDRAAPVMRRNKLKTNEREGIIVLDDGGGTIEQNQVTSNRLAGVALNENASSVVRSNTVKRNRGSGIEIRDNATASIVQNKVQENEKTGVSIHDDANVDVQENLVSHNQSAGIAVTDNSASVLERNHILKNSLSGVEIWGESVPTLRDNRVSRNAHAGVVVGSNSKQVVIENNTFKNNTLSEVVLQSDASPHITRNSYISGKTGKPTTDNPTNAFAVPECLSTSLHKPNNSKASVEDLKKHLCLEADQLGNVPVSRQNQCSLHVACQPSRLFIFASNSSGGDVTINVEQWVNQTKTVTTVRAVKGGKQQLIIPGMHIQQGSCIVCYAPRLGVPDDFISSQVVLFGFCLVADESAEGGWAKTSLTPQAGPCARQKEVMGATQARYEKNTGCPKEVLDSTDFSD